MRLFLCALLVLLLTACSRVAGESGFGSRLVPASCISAAVPWILGDAVGTAAPGEAALEAAPALRAVTYNLHSGLGPERAFFTSRAQAQRYLAGIAESISAAAGPPDVVALNEVDFSAQRSGGFDQAAYLANILERYTGRHYDVVYGETWRRRLPGFEVRFGNAALVRHPIRRANACLYDDAQSCGVPAATQDMPALQAPGILGRFTREARGLIRLAIDVDGRAVDVVVTHLDAFVLAEREAQAAHLLRRFIDPRRTTVVLGDFNTVPTVMTYTRAFFTADRTHDILTSGGLADARVLFDSRRGAADFRRWATYPSTKPVWPLDTVLGSLDLVPWNVKVIAAPYSDHNGLYVEYRVTSDAAVIAAQRARHDVIRRRQLAQIMRCDLVQASAAQLRWLAAGTGFVDIASAAERKALLPGAHTF